MRNGILRETCREATLVINWHITEACNYGCRYCYADWSSPSTPRELIHDALASRLLLQALWDHFRPGNLANPLWQRMRWDSVRLNFAGGEPLLYPRQLLLAVAEARQLGMEVSLITNGSRLTESPVQEIWPQLSVLGLSIDSASEEVNRMIGRMDRQARMLDLSKVASMLEDVRRVRAGLEIKINTVVNQANCRTDMSAIIEALRPHRWKVLRMLPVINNCLEISQIEFDEFVLRHRALASIMCVEDNNDMTDSYLMIDPLGRFYQNSLAGISNAYVYSQPILQAGVEAALACIGFSPEKFCRRYRVPGVDE